MACSTTTDNKEQEDTVEPQNEEELEACRSACEKIYGADPNCAILRPSATPDDLITYCERECYDAIQIQEGDIGDYSPNVPTDEIIELENSAMAELWIECILERTCEELEEGYCSPVW